MPGKEGSVMKKESIEKIEEFKRQYGERELSPDELDGITGGAGGIYLNTHESINSFCSLVDVLVITEGIEEATKFVTQFLPSPQVQEFITKNGLKGLGTFLYSQISGNLGDRLGSRI